MKIAVVGSYGAGMTMQIPKMPVAGETVLGGTFSSDHGGKGSNQAVGAARLGADVTFLTAVGDDAIGNDGLELWRREGVDASATIVVAEASTMAGFILVEPNGENRIVIATGALDHLRPKHVEAFRPQLAAADLVIVSMEIPLETVVAALKIAKEEGTRTLLNPAPAQPLPGDAWADIDVLTPNRSEAAILMGQPPDTNRSAEDLAGELSRRGAQTVVITLGSDGALIADEAGQRWVPAAPVRAVVDTTGAGDGFTAGLAVELAGGRSIDEAAQFAARVGAYVVGIAEVIPSLPRREDLDAATQEATR